jgi:hypothetical protein
MDATVSVQEELFSQEFPVSERTGLPGHRANLGKEGKEGREGAGLRRGWIDVSMDREESKRSSGGREGYKTNQSDLLCCDT